jgi:hypothetical protein
VDNGGDVTTIDNANIYATVVRLKHEVASNKTDMPLRLQLLGRQATQEDWVQVATDYLEECEAKKAETETIYVERIRA